MCSNTKYTSSKRRVKAERIAKTRSTRNRRKVSKLKSEGVLFQA